MGIRSERIITISSELLIEVKIALLIKMVCIEAVLVSDIDSLSFNFVIVKN